MLRLAPEQEAVLTQLLVLDAQSTASGQHEHYIAMDWSSRLSAHHGTVDTSVGNVVRELAGGSLPEAPSESKHLDHLLAKLAIDMYPALLLKEPSTPFGFPPSLSLYQYPDDKAFQTAIREDATLGVLFGKDDPSTGPSGSTLRSTGQGSGHQLWTFSSTLINAGWRLARSRSITPSAQELVTSTLESLDLVRAAVSGKDATVPARVGLTGVLLPDNVDCLDLGWGRIRRTDERDQLVIRTSSIQGQLTTTDADGEAVVINYSGDLVLEIEVPYLVQLRQLGPDLLWPEELHVGQRVIDEFIENVRLGLLLALPDSKPVIVRSWQCVLDPLAYGTATGWSDIKRTPGLMPMQLSKKQAADWETWSKRIGEKRIPAIGVALRRMLAAAAERYTPDDVLVDAVIVWENLFGAKSETVLRVTSSLAWLLGTSAEDRRARQSRYKKIYAARSDVVHGAASVRPQQIQEYSLEAVRISIDALRAIFTSHESLLQIRESELRSLHILHEG